MPSMKLAIIIPAGGSSTRFGPKDKLSQDVDGRALLLRTVEFFTKRDEVQEIIVAGPSKDFDIFKNKFGPSLSFHGVTIVQGGTKGRWESVQNALQVVSDDIDFIAVHDAARPALTNSLFDDVLLASKNFSAVAVALPIHGTVKRSCNDATVIGDDDVIADSILGTNSQAKVQAYKVSETIDRSNLWELQTPQIFTASLLQKAYESDISDCTDDAQAVEKLGEAVHLIEGDSRNIKVTTQADLQLIRAIIGAKGEQGRPAHQRF